MPYPRLKRWIEKISRENSSIHEGNLSLRELEMKRAIAACLTKPDEQPVEYEGYQVVRS